MLIAATDKKFTLTTGYASKGNYKQVLENAYTNCGAKWYGNDHKIAIAITIDCNNAEEISKAFKKYNNKNITINLTNTNYYFEASIPLIENVIFKNILRSKL